MGVVAHNLGSYKRFREQVKGAARADFIPAIAKVVGVALTKLTLDGFRRAQDPYGKAWAAVERNRARDRKARARRARAGRVVKSDKPLIDTGRMRASVTHVVSGGDVRIVIPVQYASYHQEGTKHIQARPMLPDSRGLPPKWTATINREALGVLRRTFGSGVP
jgi:phage gpG-like protein